MERTSRILDPAERLRRRMVSRAQDLSARLYGRSLTCSFSRRGSISAEKASCGGSRRGRLPLRARGLRAASARGSLGSGAASPHPGLSGCASSRHRARMVDKAQVGCRPLAHPCLPGPELNLGAERAFHPPWLKGRSANQLQNPARQSLRDFHRQAARRRFFGRSLRRRNESRLFAARPLGIVEG